jgi:asparagine synthase (glutamine-hydrolysing)
MCGILGCYSVSSQKVDQTTLESALQALRHRGPNDQGLEAYPTGNGQLHFGHTRLSIIDLSSAGHQPMKSADGRYTIVFNGEIYNYRELRSELIQLGNRFQTESDTEVLLAAWRMWQADCLPKLIGMFAFAIVDHDKNSLTLVRDPFGIKPLYYSRSDQQFSFASELPALQIIRGQAKLNCQRAYDYLVWGSYEDQEATMFQGCRQLQPGHLLEVDLKKLNLNEPERWWWPSIAERTDLTFEQAADRFRQLFLDSVRLHLRSDVPLGAALSGGLDSSAIVCAMRQMEPDLPIHTFSFIAKGSKADEENWIDLVNQHVDAHAYKVMVTPAEIVQDLDDLVVAQGEPFATTSIYAQFRVFKLASESGITVTLDGQGADESLAGYNGFPNARMRSLLQQKKVFELAGFVRNWSQWPGRSLKQATSILLHEATPEFLFKRLRSQRAALSTPAWIDQNVIRELGLELSTPRLEVYDDSYRRGLAGSLRTALTIRGLQSLLRHGDRNSMRWSIESRVPFLSVPLIEFLLTLPETYLLSPKGETKRILRKAMRGIVPDAILDRKDKIGFSTPESAWLRGCDFRPWIDQSIVSRVPFLKHELLSKFVSGQLEGNLPYMSETWRILNFCRWIELFKPVV